MSTDRREHRGIAKEDILAAARKFTVLVGKGFAAPRILAALCTADVTPGDVVALIKHEPGLTARVLRVANSALYGVKGKVATIERAVLLLGLDAVRGIAAAACLNRSLLRPKGMVPIDMDELHRHCIATAVAAEALAKIRHPRLAPEAFIAGLLHDFGVLVQLRLEPAEAERAGAALGNDADRDAAAAQLLQFIREEHEYCGAVALEAWGLPSSLVAAARSHHSPQDAPAIHRELVALVHVGDCLSRSCGMSFASELEPCEPHAAALALLGLTAEDLEETAAGLADRVVALQAALRDA